MKLNAALILILLLLLGGILEAKTMAEKAAGSMHFGALISLGGSPMDEVGREGGNWDALPGFMAAGLIRKELNPWLETQFEVQYLTRSSRHRFPHPEPYVFEMDVYVNTKMVRLPVSLIASTSHKEDETAFYLGGGASVGQPIKARMKRELHYNTEWLSSTQDIDDHFAKPVIAGQAMFGMRYQFVFMEVRLGRDITAIDLSELGINEIVPWEFWCSFGVCHLNDLMKMFIR